MVIKEKQENRKELYIRTIFFREEGDKTKYNFRKFATFLENSGWVQIPSCCNEPLFYSINKPLIRWSFGVYEEYWCGDSSYECQTRINIMAEKSKKNSCG
jgi:hypothetical protein